MSKVAALQMCSSDNLDENLQTASEFIQEAAENGAELIVLPEMFAMMGVREEDKFRIQEQPGHGKIQTFLSQQAQKNQIWVVGGTVPLSSHTNKKVYAASMVYDAQGDVRGRYDKMHLFDVVLSDQEQYRESETITPGHSIVTINTPFGKLGLAICYDIRFPELFRCMFQAGVEIIAIPAAFTVTTGMAHWEVLMRCRAIENVCYVIGAAQGGRHANGRETHGESLIIDSWGTVLVRKTDKKPGIIYADIDLNKIQQSKARIPVHDHQRIFVNLSDPHQKYS